VPSGRDGDDVPSVPTVFRCRNEGWAAKGFLIDIATVPETQQNINTKIAITEMTVIPSS
jgi:hypothetical protein